MCVCPGGSQWAALDGICHTPLAASSCGLERWSIKTGTDSTVAEVDPIVIPTTVENLATFTVPASKPDNARVGTLERTTFVVDGTLISYVMSADSNYQLIVRGETGQAMIVEVPHPSCVAAQSPYRSQIIAARAAIDNTVATTRTFKASAVPIRIFGIGFFGDLNSQQSTAPNGVELQPVLSTTFNPTGSLPALPEVNVVEYYSVATDSYFLTGRTAEKTVLDSLPTAFRRTGMTLTARSAAASASNATAICRFYFNDKGINSTHFYGTGTECIALQTTAITNKNFNDEGFDFLVGEITARTGGACPQSAPFTVYRSFRGASTGKTVNHRYTVSATTFAETNSRGYAGEGPVYCVVSATDAR